MEMPADRKETRYFEVIIRQITALISSGELKSGDRLPSERELAERFQVSRIPVREALKVLEYLGVVEMSGYSTYVKNIDMKNLLSKISSTSWATSGTIMDLMEMRILIETQAAYLAAQRRTNDDIYEIRANICQMRDTYNAGKHIEAEAASFRALSHKFHRDVIKAAHNCVMLDMYDYLYELLDISRQYTINDAGISLDSLKAHEEIFSQIMHRNADGAKAGMKRHLKTTEDKLVDTLVAGGYDKAGNGADLPTAAPDTPGGRKA